MTRWPAATHAVLLLALGGCLGTDGPLTDGYRLSGSITSAGASLGIVQVLIQTPMGGGFTFSQPNGDFEFTQIANGEYVLMAYRDGVAFTPAGRLVTVAGADIGANDFAAIGSPSHLITGHAMGGGAAHVLLTGDNTGTFVASTGGSFNIPGLRLGSYTVTPTKPGVTFTPLSRDVDGVIEIDHAQSGGIGTATLASVTTDNGVNDVADLFIFTPSYNLPEGQGTVRPKRASEVDAGRLAAYQALWQGSKVVTFTYVINAANQTFQLNLHPDHTYSATTSSSFLFTERLMGPTPLMFTTSP